MAARRADVFFAVLILLYFLSNFYVKKSVFITEDGISVAFNLPKRFERELFYYSSLLLFNIMCNTFKQNNDTFVAAKLRRYWEL